MNLPEGWKREGSTAIKHTSTGDIISKTLSGIGAAYAYQAHIHAGPSHFNFASMDTALAWVRKQRGGE